MVRPHSGRTPYREPQAKRLPGKHHEAQQAHYPELDQQVHVLVVRSAERRIAEHVRIVVARPDAEYRRTRPDPQPVANQLIAAAGPAEATLLFFLLNEVVKERRRQRTGG